MKDRVKEFQNRLEQNKKLQEQLKKLKPKRTIWGFLGVILLFFLPEFLNVFYSKEINEWIVNYASTIPNEAMANSLIWLSKESFDGEVSYLNLILGVVFLIWLFKK